MKNIATTDSKFLGTLEEWFRSQSEILVLIRYSHAAGSKDFEFIPSFEALLKRVRELPSLTSIIAFQESQLLLRGIVDDDFIVNCLNSISDGAEYLVLESSKRIYGRQSWYHHTSGMSHTELREDLEESCGLSVAVGLYPPWLVDNQNVISAIVPDENGVLKIGVY